MGDIGEATEIATLGNIWQVFPRKETTYEKTQSVKVSFHIHEN